MEILARAFEALQLEKAQFFSAKAKRHFLFEITANTAK